jgi:hypothetical protein
MVRLFALVSRERWIEVLPLHGANRPRHIAITRVRDGLQGGSKVEQECVPVPHGQRASRIEDGGELTVAQSDRPHACLPRGRVPRRSLRFTLERKRSQCDAAVLSAHIVLEKTERSSWL